MTYEDDEAAMFLEDCLAPDESHCTRCRGVFLDDDLHAGYCSTCWDQQHHAAYLEVEED